jgi:hypothetical protein
MSTRRNLISSLRGQLKEATSDTRYTNRMLWGCIHRAGKLLIKQEENQRRLYNLSDIWQTICITMEAVSPILCTCIVLPMDCVIYRSTFTLPKILESSYGFIYRFIGTADLSRRFTLVSPIDFQVKTRIRGSRENYVFLHDGFLWSTKPYNLILSGIFEDDDLSEFICTQQDDSNSDGDCVSLLDQDSGIPQYLERTTLRLALEDLLPSKQMPSDNLPNANDNSKDANSI